MKKTAFFETTDKQMKEIFFEETRCFMLDQSIDITLIKLTDEGVLMSLPMLANFNPETIGSIVSTMLLFSEGSIQLFEE